MKSVGFAVLGVGTVAVDDFLYVSQFPPPDEKVRVLSKNRKVGGLIATALAAAARAGASCAYIGTLGVDELSKTVREGFKNVGVDTSHAMVDGQNSIVHSVTVVGQQHSTRNCFFHLPMEPLRGEQVDEQTIGSSAVLIVDQLGKEAARCARRLGIPVVADMEWSDWPDCREMMQMVDHLIVSRSFACAITGAADPVDALLVLHRQSRRACTAVTSGSNGVYYLSGHEMNPPGALPAFPVQAVETTGCGDVLHGVYAASLARKKTVMECLRYGAAAAALYASKPSGWEYLPTWAEIEALVKRTVKVLEWPNDSEPGRSRVPDV